MLYADFINEAVQELRSASGTVLTMVRSPSRTTVIGMNFLLRYPRSCRGIMSAAVMAGN